MNMIGKVVRFGKGLIKSDYIRSGGLSATNLVHIN